MSDSIENRGTAQENSYFEKKNQEALSRLKKKKEENKPRLSPFNGEEMATEVLHGVVIDKCLESGGIWLDAGELEELVAAMVAAKEEGGESMLKSFFSGLTGK